MRDTLALACAAIIGLTALAEQAEALAVVDDYAYPELRQNPSQSLAPRLPMFIDLKEVEDRIRSARERTRGPAGGTFPTIDFGSYPHLGADPVYGYGRLWRSPSDDLPPFAQFGFTMDVTDGTVRDSALPPAASSTDPADTTSVEETVLTDLIVTNFTVAKGFLYAGDFQQPVPLKDREVVTNLLNGIESGLLSSINRSTNINDLAAVPLPGSVVMLLSALALFGWLGRKRLLAKRG